jgi:hypothetical protein
LAKPVFGVIEVEKRAKVCPASATDELLRAVVRQAGCLTAEKS